MKPKSAHRYRICGTPVRTGCITCKIRRVKCGEEKPFCKRCTSTGRKCDGYAPPSETKPGHKRPPQKALSLHTHEDPMERNTLHFFSTFTAPKLSGYLSPNFWEQRVPQAGLSEPSVRHAMIAIGAVHQDFIARHQNTRDPSLKSFATGHYTKAISHLHHLVSTRTQQLDTTLISCILFVVFDCLIGNHENALMHLKAGLKILQDIKLQNSHGGANFPSSFTHEWEREFAPLLLGLGVQAASFINPRYQRDRTGLWESLKAVRIPTHPLTFHSLDEARHALESIAVDVMGDRNSTDPMYDYLNSEIPNTQTHLTALTNWTKALDRYLLNYAGREPSESRVRHGANVLRVHSLMMTVIVAPSSNTANFERMLSLCERLVPSNANFSRTGATLAFVSDFGIIAPLSFIALQTSNVPLIQRAYDLLARAPGREGMWDSDDALLAAGDAIMGATTQFANYQYPITPISAPYPQKDELAWDEIQERLHAEPYAQSPEQDLSIFESLEQGGPLIHSPPLDFGCTIPQRQFSVESNPTSESFNGSEYGSEPNEGSFGPPFIVDDFVIEYPGV